MSVPVGRRQLFESRARTVVAVGGVALAMLLVLALDGVFAGVIEQITAYMDNEPFDVVVAQQGVRNLHMTSSQFPLAKLEEVRRVEGVQGADPILYATTFLVSGENRNLAYVMGFEPGKIGGPWQVENVPRRLPRGDIVMDGRIASEDGLRIDDTITALGKDFRIAGFNNGTVNITNSLAFIRFDDFEKATGVRGVASFGLIRVKRGQNPSTVAGRIRDRVSGLSVMTRQQFAENERQIVSDMSIDIMRIMNVIAFLIGLAVVALTVYTSTFAKLGEYGVLKAVGARTTDLLRIVFSQAVISVTLGLLFAVILAFAIAGVLRLAGSTIQLLVTPLSVARVGIAAAGIALLGSAIPVGAIAGIKPADVLRR